MIVALSNIGRLLEGGEGLAGRVENVEADYAIEIRLRTAGDGGRFELDEVRLAAFDASDPVRYLYRKGPANTCGTSPTYFAPRPDKKKSLSAAEKTRVTLAIKVRKYFADMAEPDGNRPNSLFERIHDALANEELAARAAELADQVAAQKKKAVLVVVVDGRYPAEVPEIASAFERLTDPATSKRGGNDAVGGPGVCAACGRESAELYACRPQTLGWFSLDKPQYAAGGLLHGLSGEGRWIVFPVCGACSLSVRKGAQAVERRLNFRYIGMRYLLVPDAADWSSASAAGLLRSLESMQNEADTDVQRDRELLFSRKLGRESTLANVSFVFYEKVQSRVVILAAIQNVLPSRLAEVAAAAERAAGFALLQRFAGWSRIDTEIPVDFRLFYGLHAPDIQGTKYEAVRDGFLASARRILVGQRFDREAFFATVAEFLRHEVRSALADGREPDLRLPVHRALAAAFWLVELDLLLPGAGVTADARHIPGDPMTAAPALNDRDFDAKLDAFFGAYGTFFHNDAQKVCYLMGLMCAQVLAAQRRQLDNRQPFFRNLKDLSLDEAEMRALYPQMKQKLVEYDKDHFCWNLEAALARRFREAGSPWRLPKAELNFFFALGLSEAGLFFSPSKEADDDQ